MPSENYSFLDVAVLEPVRRRFAAGDALAILSIDLDQVIWANGPGASMFGYSDIEAIIGATTGLPLVARRQIMATNGFPNIGTDRAIAVRLASGMSSRTISFKASAVTMPDSEKAILLAVPAVHAGSRGSSEIAASAIGGFTEDGHFIAFIDGQGCIEAASDGFSALGITRETLTALIADVAGESGRIVKRLLPGNGATYPAGLARLTDDPARHLLVVIDEDKLESEARPAVSDEPLTSQGLTPEGAKTGVIAPAIEALAREPEIALPRERKPDQPPSVSTNPDTAHPIGETPADGESPHHDHWYFNSEKNERIDTPHLLGTTVLPAPEEPPATAESRLESGAGDHRMAGDVMNPQQPSPLPDRSTSPVRFVWRTDAKGHISAISREFCEIVGQSAESMIGRPFKDVATALGLDPAGEIVGLLDRRDTWSGRSVLWPVAGISMRIPVDLAALPIYDRNRAFEGFRGFGVARAADAVHDPEAAALEPVPVKSKPDQAEPDAPEPTAKTPHDEQAGAETSAVQSAPDSADPFRGEVPALTIVPKQERRFTDKVIRLAEHRQPANDKGLSMLERSAFREIGERLRKDDSPPAAEAAKRDDSKHIDDSTRASAKMRSTPDNTGQSADSTPGVTGSASEAIRQQGSLLNYANREADKVESGQDNNAPRDETQESETGSEDHAIEVTGAVAATENRAAADFRDSEADQNPPQEKSDVAALHGKAVDSPGMSQDTILEKPVVTEQPLRPVFKSEEFVPSAFAQGHADTPETSILSKLPVPVLIHSGDALHYANQDFLDLTGYATLLELEQAGGLDALFTDTYDDNSAVDRTDRLLRLRTRGGTEFPIEALLRSVQWRAGKALMLLVRRSGEDEAAAAISEHGAETQPDVSELKARIAEMRTIIDTATDGVVLIGRDGTIRSISRPAEALFGFDSDEVAGKPFAALFAIESQRAARDYLAGLSEPGVASVMNDGREVIGREAEGRFIPLFMSLGRLPGDSGFCAVVRDITQWKRAEEDLTQARAVAERASSQKTDFLARISHEIRTPLNAIIGFSELMVDEKFGPVANDRYRDYLRDINRSGNHVLDLVNDLLDISKIEAGQQEMDYEAVSLNDTLTETVAMMQPQANRERVIIRSSFASKLPEVVADMRSVRQIALNILSNAIRYTQAGGQVIVSTAYESSGEVVMRVRDTGIGMSQAEIEQALKPFKQINALKRGRGDGTGLGLPLTKAMVEANRARFTINSTPGEGTLVEVAFPSVRVLAE